MGSICIGVTFFMSMVSSIAADQMGLRQTGMIGGILACSGMVASAFAYTVHLEILYFTYGVLMGLGFAFSYTPSLVIVGHYFKVWFLYAIYNSGCWFIWETVFSLEWWAKLLRYPYDFFLNLNLEAMFVKILS